ncbi:MAG TPA: glycosyltransferase [Ramlibacter sp.]|nr:glycosyltransferase [Ramlibacter sp.]
MPELAKLPHTLRLPGALGRLMARGGARAVAEDASKIAALLAEGRVAQAQPLLGAALASPAAHTQPDLLLLAANLQGGSPARRLERLNGWLALHALAPLALKNPSLPPGPQNVRAAGRLPAQDAGPLVSVLMTTYDSAAWVEAAVESVLAQTWRRLELIVVDDASRDDTVARVAALAARDARVRLVRLPRNAGTYAAKHVGLQHARGEFITCHDSDDWSHPAKIALQVAPLMARPRLVCTSSCWVRMDGEGDFVARQLYPLARWNPSSPLFRRDRVLREAGAWDVVLTGADSELLDRFRAVFGPEALLRLSQPLALGSHRPGSLMTDAGTGYTAEGESPARVAYVAAWTAWHAQQRAQDALPRLPVDVAQLTQRRPFATPDALLAPADAVLENLREAGVPGFAAAASRQQRWVAMSRAVAGIPTLAALLEGDVVRPWASGRGERPAGVLAWGRKPSALRAVQWARQHQLPVMRLEDGFLRSFGAGDRYPPLSLVMDDVGIYYDSTTPSALENLLNGPTDLLAGIQHDVARARALLLEHGLSKYNHAPPWRSDPAPGARKVLVVDQTRGDVSVTLGGADAGTFNRMLAAARAENPGATVVVKTHPDVAAGRKGGYLTEVMPDESTVVLRELAEPMGLLRSVDRVYVVSSTLGFEALLAGKPVTCFGLPWYAGWGATDDRQACERRARARSVDELFAAGYFHYARYVDPVTHGRGTIFDVIDWLARQRRMAFGAGEAQADGAGAAARGLTIAIGLRRWKAANLAPMLSLLRDQLRFARDATHAAAMQPTPADRLLVWGGMPPPAVAALAERSGARLVRMEDGFVRSVGLGSDLIRPMSLVLDATGIYFDATGPSGLERLLGTATFTADELAQAARVREFIVAHGVTKYNLEPRGTPQWPSAGKLVVLAPGQVEDDASIRLGAARVNTNLALLRAARQARPDAFIVYKPHPDVSSGNRHGRVALIEALRFADAVETRLSVVSCVESCDEVHTITSLTGFDALLRGKRVVAYGQPFYAGWGLTEDVPAASTAWARRQRRLTLDELVAGAMLRYPVYWDWQLRGYTSCMGALHRIVEQREALESAGQLRRLRVGYWRRQARKLAVLARAWTGRQD